MKYLLVVFAALLFSRLPESQDDAEQVALFEKIMALDSVLFEEGFNQCDLDAIYGVVAEDLDFYHDVNGTQDKESFMLAMEESICSSPDRKPIRKPLMETMEVFPLSNAGKLYGALQTGTHEFFIREPGKDLYKTNIAKFNHLWILRDGKWLLKTSFSFDHRKP